MMYMTGVIHSPRYNDRNILSNFPMRSPHHNAEKAAHFQQTIQLFWILRLSIAWATAAPRVRALIHRGHLHFDGAIASNNKPLQALLRLGRRVFLNLDGQKGVFLGVGFGGKGMERGNLLYREK
jgi:hypothetical protein